MHGLPFFCNIGLHSCASRSCGAVLRCTSAGSNTCSLRGYVTSKVCRDWSCLVPAVDDLFYTEYPVCPFFVYSRRSQFNKPLDQCFRGFPTQHRLSHMAHYNRDYSSICPKACDESHWRGERAGLTSFLGPDLQANESSSARPTEATPEDRTVTIIVLNRLKTKKATEPIFQFLGAHAPSTTRPA